MPHDHAGTVPFEMRQGGFSIGLHTGIGMIAVNEY
jgi:hypothetical protein